MACVEREAYRDGIGTTWVPVKVYEEGFSARDVAIELEDCGYEKIEHKDQEWDYYRYTEAKRNRIRIKKESIS